MCDAPTILMNVRLNQAKKWNQIKLTSTRENTICASAPFTITITNYAKGRKKAWRGSRNASGSPCLTRRGLLFLFLFFNFFFNYFCFFLMIKMKTFKPYGFDLWSFVIWSCESSLWESFGFFMGRWFWVDLESSR